MTNKTLNCNARTNPYLSHRSFQFICGWDFDGPYLSSREQTFTQENSNSHAWILGNSSQPQKIACDLLIHMKQVHFMRRRRPRCNANTEIHYYNCSTAPIHSYWSAPIWLAHNKNKTNPSHFLLGRAKMHCIHATCHSCVCEHEVHIISHDAFDDYAILPAHFCSLWYWSACSSGTMHRTQHF